MIHYDVSKDQEFSCQWPQSLNSMSLSSDFSLFLENCCFSLISSDFQFLIQFEKNVELFQRAKLNSKLENGEQIDEKKS